MSIEAMKQAAAAFDRIIDGCNGIEEEDTDPEAKKVARLVRKDCLRALEALCQAIAKAEKQESVAIGEEWKPCVKLPIVVHVREQRKGETHISTREGITPVKEDDLIMRGVAGEEYPIGRELFNRTYTFDTAPVHAIADAEDAVAAEREACARLAEDGLIGHTIAKAIRARGIDLAKVGEVGTWGDK